MRVQSIPARRAPLAVAILGAAVVAGIVMADGQRPASGPPPVVASRAVTIAPAPPPARVPFMSVDLEMGLSPPRPDREGATPPTATLYALGPDPWTGECAALEVTGSVPPSAVLVYTTDLSEAFAEVCGRP